MKWNNINIIAPPFIHLLETLDFKVEVTFQTNTHSSIRYLLSCPTTIIPISTNFSFFIKGLGK